MQNRCVTWITTRGDWEKYQRGTPNKLSRAAFVSYVSEQRVLRMLPPAGRPQTHTCQVWITAAGGDSTPHIKSYKNRNRLRTCLIWFVVESCESFWKSKPRSGLQLDLTSITVSYVMFCSCRLPGQKYWIYATQNKKKLQINPDQVSLFVSAFLWPCFSSRSSSLNFSLLAGLSVTTNSETRFVTSEIIQSSDKFEFHKCFCLSSWANDILCGLLRIHGLGSLSPIEHQMLKLDQQKLQWWRQYYYILKTQTNTLWCFVSDLQTPERSPPGRFGPEKTGAERSSRSHGRPGRDERLVNFQKQLQETITRLNETASGKFAVIKVSKYQEYQRIKTWWSI